jgi:hypothetical protein
LDYIDSDAVEAIVKAVCQVLALYRAYFIVANARFVPQAPQDETFVSEATRHNERGSHLTLIWYSMSFDCRSAGMMVKGVRKKSNPLFGQNIKKMIVKNAISVINISKLNSRKII